MERRKMPMYEDYSDLRKELRDIVVMALQLEYSSGGESTIVSKETKTHQVIKEYIL